MKLAGQQDDNIIVTGMVDDVRPYLAAATVMAVPLVHGGGTRLKILEAFAAGCPVVSTRKGAEGISVTDGKNILLRDSVPDMITGITTLWESYELREQLRLEARELVSESYSRTSIGQVINSAISQLPLKL
jgi:glycosyltransferase involved in cell wall biosynthesis